MNPNRTRDRVSGEMFNHSKVVTNYIREYSSIIFEPIYLRSSYDSHEKKEIHACANGKRNDGNENERSISTGLARVKMPDEIGFLKVACASPT